MPSLVDTRVTPISVRVTHAPESVSPPVVGMRFGYTRVSTVAQTLHQRSISRPSQQQYGGSVTCLEEPPEYGGLMY